VSVRERPELKFLSIQMRQPTNGQNRIKSLYTNNISTVFCIQMWIVFYVHLKTCMYRYGGGRLRMKRTYTIKTHSCAFCTFVSEVICTTSTIAYGLAYLISAITHRDYINTLRMVFYFLLAKINTWWSIYFSTLYRSRSFYSVIPHETSVEANR